MAANTARDPSTRVSRARPPQHAKSRRGGDPGYKSARERSFAGDDRKVCQLWNCSKSRCSARAPARREFPDSENEIRSPTPLWAWRDCSPAAIPLPSDRRRRAAQTPARETASGGAGPIPSARVNSALVTGLGATAFTGPRTDSWVSTCRKSAIRSSSAIQAIHWRPSPRRPPTPMRNGSSMRGSAPPVPLSTMPMRSMTVRMPASLAGARRLFPLPSHFRQES